MSENHAIQVSKLTKIYPPELRAVDELDLAVREGEIMALLGPNGAGKSTTIRVLSTLCGFDSGQAIVGGIDIDAAPDRVRQTIGVVAQKTGVDHFLTGRENMTLQGHLYRMKKSEIQSRTKELAEYFELSDSLDKPVMAYSGGMTRKLDIATALIHRPKILYLDEPTLGLDIRSRKVLWNHIEELNRKFGLTILLTTHYLEEADKLSHRVSIINSGKIRIVGTPDDLKSGIHGDSVVLSFEKAGELERKYAERMKETGIARDAVWEDANLHLYVNDGARSVPRIIEQAASFHIEVRTLSLARPTLDDVFLKYTGASLLDKDDEEPEQWWTQWAGKGGGGDWKKQAKKWGYTDDQEDASWQGNEWADKDGNPRDAEGQDAASTATEKPERSEPSDGWKGNEWVDKDGKPRDIDEQDEASPAAEKPERSEPSDGWKGNEWVDKDGNPKDTDEQDAASPAAEKPERSEPSDGWKGNEWVDKDGKPRMNRNKKDSGKNRS